MPGVDETLRVNGRPTSTTDPVVLDAVAVDGRRPPIAIGIDVQECFIHCATAFRRSSLWDHTTWPEPQDRPSAARALRDHIGLQASADVVASDLEAGYESTMWEAGG